MSSTMTMEDAKSRSQSCADNARYWTEQARKHKRMGQRLAALTYAISARDALRRSRYFAMRARQIRNGTSASAAPCEQRNTND
jgi:hypothetical protein